LGGFLEGARAGLLQLGQNVYDIGTSPIRAGGALLNIPIQRDMSLGDLIVGRGPESGKEPMSGLLAMLPMLGAMRGAQQGPLTKVLTEAGRPKQVYHGTPQVFSEFDPKYANAKSLYGPGHYFTENADVAAGYTQTKKITGKAVMGPDGKYSVERAPNVRPAYLDVTKPFDMDREVGEGTIEKIAKAVDKKYGEGAADYARETAEAAAEQLNHTGHTVYRIFSQRAMDKDGNPIGQAAMNALLKELGFDGITHVGGQNKGMQHRVWIAFDPKQIHNPYEYEAQQRGLNIPERK
jgi:hypothetical protein